MYNTVIISGIRQLRSQNKWYRHVQKNKVQHNTQLNTKIERNTTV